MRDTLRKRAQHNGKQHVLDIDICPDSFFLPAVDKQLQWDMAELRAIRKRRLQSQTDDTASAEVLSDGSTKQEENKPKKE